MVTMAPASVVPALTSISMVTMAPASVVPALTSISMVTMAPVNKSGKRGKSKRSVRPHASGSVPGSGRAPPADDLRRNSESSEEFLQRLVRTLKVDEQGLSPLHVACMQGQLGSLQHMLESGEWWINSSDDSQGRRPLHMFLSIQSSPQALTCLRYLLQQGADVNLPTASGQTPLHVAAAEGQMAYAQILVEAGADLFARDHSGLLPLDMARMWNHRSIGRYLKDCMWREQNNKDLEARMQTQTLYCELMDCDKREKINKKPTIDKNVAEWANKKGISLRKEFCPEVLDTIQRVLFPRDFPPRIPALGPFQPKGIEGVQHRACPQGRSSSAWTDVAMHLQETLEPGHY
uniref:Uncharacterized protein n=2 Tax=Knipowitschia caucasica TaxID=637954 RepID=A0AAV2KTD4_KNICA